MEIKTILFITFTNKQSGLGHLLRTIRIAKEIKKKHKCLLFINNKNIQTLENNEINETFSANEIFTIEQIATNNVMHMLRATSPVLLWVDIPHSERNIIKKIPRIGPIVSMNMFRIIDSTSFHEDLSVHPVFEPFEKKITHGKIEISGVDFIHVDDDFFVSNTQYTKKNGVLVFLGGTDPKGLTELVIKSILLGDGELKYTFILPKNKDKCVINTQFNIQQKNITLLNFGEVNFCSALKASKYAIINGGMTRYECIAAKTFFIALSIHNKQYEITEKVSKFGLGINFGVFDESKIAKLSNTLSKITTYKIKSCNLSPKLNNGSAIKIFNKIIDEMENLKNESVR